MQSISNQWSEQLLMQMAGLESQTLPESTIDSLHSGTADREHCRYYT